MTHVEALGPVHADIVSVGVFLKNPRKFAEYGARYWHVANVRVPDDVDADLLDLLAEAYHDEPL